MRGRGIRLEDCLTPQIKSKIKAGDGAADGRYKFFLYKINIMTGQIIMSPRSSLVRVVMPVYIIAPSLFRPRRIVSLCTGKTVRTSKRFTNT